jgi:hypothetical protein
MSLRARAITDLKNQNLRDWPLPVILRSPDGVTYDMDAETGEQLQAVQVLYDRRSQQPDTGETIIVHEPIVILARSSLARIPAAGENWQIRFPLDPTDPDTLSDYVFTPDRAAEGGNSLGLIRVYPQKVEQS